ncbi:MAG TPA: Arc family DNA-binding protein [Syntrophales bacterium]|jgi:plasmid stability protein|nr:Arc family DNA-binding protein [Syntrophales bacterium]
MEPSWNQEALMPVNLSIKNVPDRIADRLRKRASRHHRSLQGELLAILEESVAGEKLFTAEEFLVEVRKSGLKTPAEAVRMVREDRDDRSRR